MKKTISILITLAMLLTSCVMFSSCGAVSEKDLQNDPYTALNESWQKTSERFFEEDADAAKVLKKASDKGKFTVTLGSQDPMLEIPNVSATLYTDSSAQKIVANVSADREGTQLDANLFLSKEMLALSVPALLGTNDAYAIYFATFADDLEGSVFADALGVDVEMMKETMKSVNDALAQAIPNEEDQEKLKEEFKKLCEALKMSVTTEEGNIVVTYTLNNETIKAAIGDGSSLKDLFADSGLNEDLLDVSVDITAKIVIAPKDGFIEKLSFDGSVESEGNTATLSAALTFSSDKIALHIDGDSAGEKITADATLSKTVTADQTSYNLVVNGGTANVTAKILDATYILTKSGDITCTVDIIEDQSNTVRFGFKGKYESTDERVAFSVTELTAEGETVKLDLSVAIEAVSEIPSFPENAKDIVKMTEAELAELIGKIAAEKFGSVTD